MKAHIIERFKGVLCLAFVVSGLLIPCRISTAEKLIWNKEIGWIEMGKLSNDTLDQRYKHALALITDQQYIPAIRELESIIKDAPNSEFVEPSMFSIAHAYFLANDYGKAFKTYDTFLKKHPGTRRTEDIIAKQYNLAVTQMEGLEVKAAIKMFEKIIEHNPLGPYAADAQIKIADSYQKLRKFDQATENYEKLIENFNDSAWVPYAQFQIPMCKVEDERRKDRNYGLLTEAEDGFNDYIANNPRGSLVDEAKKKMNDIQTAKAAREFKIGEFYLRLKKPKSAKVYYEIVEKNFPGTVWSAKASEKLKFLQSVGAIK